MSTLIVLGHPLKPSLAARLADDIAAQLAHAGQPCRVVDLYQDGYDPVLSAAERDGYYSGHFNDSADLQTCTRLILVFPTWWFGLPAIMKGWIDRSFLPGVAFDHPSDLSALRPRLRQMREVLVVTTLGSPWWVDVLILRQPVKRALKWGVIKACAPHARFRMISLYRAEQVEAHRLARFSKRLSKAVESLT